MTAYSLFNPLYALATAACRWQCQTGVRRGTGPLPGHQTGVPAFPVSSSYGTLGCIAMVLGGKVLLWAVGNPGAAWRWR